MADAISHNESPTDPISGAHERSHPATDVVPHTITQRGSDIGAHDAVPVVRALGQFRSLVLRGSHGYGVRSNCC